MSTDRKSLTLVNRMSVTEGGTYAGAVMPGDEVATHNGIKLVERSEEFMSDGDEMVALIFRDDFMALLPVATEVQVVATSSLGY